MDAFCAKYNLDPKVSKDRLKATRKAEQDALAQWRETKANATVPHKRPQSAIADLNDSIDANLNDDISVDRSAEQDAAQIGHRLSTLLLDDHADEEEPCEDENTAVDAAMVSSIMFDQMDAGELNKAPTPLPHVPNALDMTRMTSLDFVKTFSTINTTNLCLIASASLAKRKVLLAALDGNSRDPASVMQYACRNRNVNGCTYTTTRRCYIKGHEDKCDATLPAKETHGCTEPGCNKVFDSEATLKTHRKREHCWTAAPCPYGCEPDKLYTLSAYNKHVRDNHAFAALKCPVGRPECMSNRSFKTRHLLDAHFRKSHAHMDTVQINRLIASTHQGVDSSVPAASSTRKAKVFKTPAIVIESEDSDDELHLNRL